MRRRRFATAFLLRAGVPTVVAPALFPAFEGRLPFMKPPFLFAACLLLTAGGCGPKAPAPAAAASEADGTETDGTGAPDAASAAESPAPPPPPPSGKVAACTTDASCNADPSISALWGACDVETGKCNCREGAELDPISQRCQPLAQ